MNDKSKGAWIIHHTKKLQQFVENTDFEDIEEAGRIGQFLSGLAASDEESTTLPDGFELDYENK